jgi:TolB-like protein/class 3 adenylate cyclase
MLTNRPTPSLPTGTVTFLFTDIEGSTRLWETQHEAMRTALVRHDALMRRSIEDHDGHVVKTVGDGFHAAFDRATDALAAALAAQLALHAEPWPEALSLRVRMALHSGSAELRDGDYYGPTLNRAGRLLGIGSGGQTLLSESTHDLCRDLLPAGVTLKPLGEQSLRDLTRREAVFQLCHSDLPAAFPSLNTLLAPFDKNTPSIAVLPFMNLSREEDNEYFADGLAEELLNVLSKIHGLRVASRTSAFSFKGTQTDIPTVALKLNVATILEGSVRKSGKRVRITAQLIQVATDSHLWSNTYDRELEDIFAVQYDIAQSVVNELRTTLLGAKSAMGTSAQVKAEVQAAVKGRVGNVQAYEFYLRGRFFTERLTREDEARGISYFQQAVQLDPEYALAWAGLSRGNANEAGNGWAPLAEGFARARAAAERALALDPDLAEGHAALGRIQMLYDWDWKGADASYRRALELAPGNAQVVRYAAHAASFLGRMDEAIALTRRAITLDPLSVPAYRNLAYICLCEGRLDDAEAAVERALELNPQAALAHYTRGLIRLAEGRNEEALAAAEREINPIFGPLGLSLTRHALGQSTESDAALRALIEKDSDDAAYQIAQIHAYRNERDQAFEWLSRACEQRDPGIAAIRQDVLLRNLHRDPRWRPLVEKIGLAD